MTEVRRVEANGLSFRCRLDGSDHNAPWVVFSNSIGTDLSVWDEQVAALGERFRVLRYDQRGHGGTGVPTGPCDFEQLGGDLVALLDHFRIERCRFVGLSMGVPTGLQIVSKHPKRIERLVLCDGQAATAPGGASAWEERIEQARTKGMSVIADAMITRWFAPAFIAAGKADRVRAMIASTPVEGFAACAKALQSYAFTDVLQTIRVPTVLVVGARNGAMPVTMARMGDAIAGAELIEITDAGHIPNVEQPAAFNRALLGFLQ